MIHLLITRKRMMMRMNKLLKRRNKIINRMNKLMKRRKKLMNRMNKQMKKMNRLKRKLIMMKFQMKIALSILLEKATPALTTMVLKLIPSIRGSLMLTMRTEEITVSQN